MKYIFLHEKGKLSALPTSPDWFVRPALKGKGCIVQLDSETSIEYDETVEQVVDALEEATMEVELEPDIANDG